MTESTTAYRVWAFIHENPECTMSDISDGVGMKTTDISGAVSVMSLRGELVRSGTRGKYRYSVSDRLPPKQPQRSMLEKEDGLFGVPVTVKSTAGNPVFDECRQYSGNYLLTKLVREVRCE